MAAADQGNIAFLGAGSMGGAILSGLLASGYPAASIRATTSSRASAEKLAADHSIVAVSGESNERANLDAAEWADVVVLGVKPYRIVELVGRIAPALASSGTLVVSVAAGITIDAIVQAAPGAAVVRAMPNTPSLIGRGMAGVAAGGSASDDDLEAARAILRSVGDVLTVDEAQMDAVGAICGSGPAYYFAFTEALIEAGKALGLSAEDAGTLAVRTAAGAGALMVESGTDPATLRSNVTSPGGTTEAALKHFGPLAGMIADATAAAVDRSREMSRP
ncbi:pyrroline-5-carboxylate reductase [Spelaeicoccus albus]|uniref:Pyrroline-5-carboxylate reductase n=1 Tax=Spelaeicoccus albus TaxID=1280376 RepID=A0A7Z0D5V5_9MICO|nr:pyrroline-5-carboxylate reductase [Spelaeicoccus albus]NYI69399.1 pyrroline-5-carboxylate reductase [Spelaeicoccus albus]